jgi:hypothetical protein
MRIVDAESVLLKDFVDEIDLVASRTTPSFKVYAGRHPTLGRVVIVEGEEGDGLIVEVE